MAAKMGIMGKSFDSNLLSGVYKMIILHHMRGKGTYPYKLYKQLLSHMRPGMPHLSKSDLYNIMSSLEKDGFAKSRAIREGAVVHKYYTLTKKGSIVVRNSRKIARDAFERTRKLIRDELNG